MSELAKGWVKTTLGQVVDYGRTEKANSEHISDDTWVLELEDIEKNSSKLLNKVSFLERQPKSSKNAFKVGDVLYGKLRPYLNKIIIATDNGICTSEIIPLRVEKGLVDNHFLFYWLKGIEFSSYVTAVSYGVNMPRLGTKDGKQAPFILAPLAEQKRIVEKLDQVLAQVDTIKARLDGIPAILKRFRQSVLAAAVSGKLTEEWRGINTVTESAIALKTRWLTERRNCFAEEQKKLLEKKTIRKVKQYKEPINPDLETSSYQCSVESWEIISVSQFAECLDSQRIPVKKEERSVAKGIYPYFGANGEVDRVDDYLFDDDLVLVTEDETFYGREKPIAYRYTGKCWVNNHAHVLKAPTKAANDFLCFNLMFYRVIPWLTGTTGRAKLTQGALNSLPIGLPPEKEMNEIVRLVDQYFAFADTIEKQVQKAQQRVDKLTQSILAKAFRGELVPQDPTDEPADELLKRIATARAESEALAKAAKKVGKKTEKS